jgi:hypothetical protein
MFWVRLYVEQSKPVCNPDASSLATAFIAEIHSPVLQIHRRDLRPLEWSVDYFLASINYKIYNLNI